ncbi:SurA N-terminal domain-containing protein [Paludibacterium yongneupense]|uniref:SurA N-terminal domain-containing protein n=1 Tax=Paludibacterium yongneupense TaxID=400061 RepID=UPI0003FDD06D|nr:SurA N-terminal domain-containing protein [Paludibacterium yongneupense]
MYEFVEKNNVAIKIILGAVALTFVGFGVGSYSSAVDDPFLVKVGSVKITRQDLDRAMEGQPNDAASRQLALDGLVRNELLLADARDNGFGVTTTQLQRAIMAVPEFQDNGKFSQDLYLQFLKDREMSASRFETRLSRDLLLQAQVSPFTASQIVSHTVVARMAALLGEGREVRALVLTPQSQASRVKTDDATLTAYYNANRARYKTPDSVRLDYVQLSQDGLAQSLQVSDAEVEKFYQQHQASFSPEKRTISHILLTVAKGASAQDKARVKAQAEALSKEARQHPERFAELARSRSQDPGSAGQGGSLGEFDHDTLSTNLVKPFADAAWALKAGQISGPVETQFGYHIIRVDSVTVPDFATVKDKVVQALKQQKAAATFRAASDKLSEVSYQQGDSLKAAQDALKLDVQHTGWVSRGKPGSDPVSSNPKVIAAAFSDDVLKKKHNSDVIDLGHNTLVVVRVAEHQAERQQTFADVRDAIRAELVARDGSRLSEQSGLALLAKFKAGNDIESQAWSQPHVVSRTQQSGLPVADMRAIFSVPGSDKLPRFAGVKHDNGDYVIYRVDKLLPAPAISAEQQTQLASMISQVYSNAQAGSYLSGLRKRYTLSVGKQMAEQQ